MRIEYKVNGNLPPLAWLAEVKNNNIIAYCGENVEMRDTFFVEGAWNGNFQDGDFTDSSWFCGSGGKIESDQIIFSTPTHVTSGLFVSSISGGY